VNAPTRIAVVGSGSLVAGALRQHPQAASWDYIAHDRALSGRDWLEGVGLVINCAIDPRLKTSAYDVGFDVDVRLAQMLSPHTRYVMLSSRLAYGPAGPDMRLVEQCPPKPDRPYGINKLMTERALTALLGDRLTVLRLSNVFGAEDRPGRQSFFAQALRRLRSEGRILLDMSPSSSATSSRQRKWRRDWSRWLGRRVPACSTSVPGVAWPPGASRSG
jgi:UDP-glucose 4-epimerase